MNAQQQQKQEKRPQRNSFSAPPTPTRVKKTAFTKSSIKRIMQSNEDVGKMAAAVPTIVSKCAELFLRDLINGTSTITKNKGAKTMSCSHLKECVESNEKFDFLREKVKDIQLVPDKKEDEEPGKKKRKRSTSTKDADRNDSATTAEQQQPKTKRRKKSESTSSSELPAFAMEARVKLPKAASQKVQPPPQIPLPQQLPQQQFIPHHLQQQLQQPQQHQSITTTTLQQGTVSPISLPPMMNVSEQNSGSHTLPSLSSLSLPDVTNQPRNNS